MWSDAFCSLPGLNPARSDVEYPSAEMESYLVAISILRMYVQIFYIFPNICVLPKLLFFISEQYFPLVQLLCPTARIWKLKGKS